ncbi:hypothetical protein A4A49_38825 [Nicotiana attenuata]|uniref:Uncharacterized protein n=1 Tax=Nicotiana attenuata TaxID=49451 RepID=A0A1J6JWF7_NICAT|nr:hypothetical protein A4A49_38825 [Nicotiana attenuata]
MVGLLVLHRRNLRPFGNPAIRKWSLTPRLLFDTCVGESYAEARANWKVVGNESTLGQGGGYRDSNCYNIYV